MSKRLDLTGKKFGMLIAIKDVGADKHGARLWECQCDCGNTTVLRTQTLISGLTKSCGCFMGKGHGLPEGEASFNALYANYKRFAKIKGMKFNLSKDKFRELINQNCYYCGIKPAQEYRPSSTYNGNYIYNGIDRVNNSKGYVEGNCVPCCIMCNQWKKAYTKEDFLDHITKIYENCITRSCNARF